MTINRITTTIAEMKEAFYWAYFQFWFFVACASVAWIHLLFDNGIWSKLWAFVFSILIVHEVAVLKESKKYELDPATGNLRPVKPEATPQAVPAEVPEAPFNPVIRD